MYRIKKDVIITFDYEVFLGQNTGSLLNSVITPTKLILEVLKKNNAKAIFFVDATWLLFLEENFPEDFQLVTHQVKDIINIGSSVELHLHPQWLQAYKKGNKIQFKSLEKYRLHSLNQSDIFDLFRKSIELLENITYQKVKCFRAGGFCIEPFAQIKKAFEAFEIKYDFSVVPGMLLNRGKEYDFNFSEIPRVRFYKFQDDFNKPVSDGSFLEIPLTTYMNNPVYRITNKILLMLKRDKIFGDGNTIYEKSFFSSSLLFQRIELSYSMLTIDRTSKIFFKYLLKIHFKNSDFLVIISHPKTISKEALNNLSYVTEKYNTLNTLNLDKLLVG